MLAPSATTLAATHLAALDEALPGRVEGYYLVGSAALGDWEARVSNLDVVVVADGDWVPHELERAATLHGALAVGGGAPAVCCTTYAELAGPAGAAPTWRGAREAEPGEGLDTPFTRAVLGNDAIAVRGSEWFDVGDAGPEAVAAWARARLAGPWRRFADAAHPPPSLWRRSGLAESLLEVCRLSVAAAEGRVVAKLQSVPAVAARVSTRFDRVLRDAAGFRQGSRTSMYWGPAERKAHSLDLIRLLVAET